MSFLDELDRHNVAYQKNGKRRVSTKAWFPGGKYTRRVTIDMFTGRTVWRGIVGWFSPETLHFVPFSKADWRYLKDEYKPVRQSPKKNGMYH